LIFSLVLEEIGMAVLWPLESGFEALEGCSIHPTLAIIIKSQSPKKTILDLLYDIIKSYFMSPLPTAEKTLNKKYMNR
jgi:hypothetical protein